MKIPIHDCYFVLQVQLQQKEHFLPSGVICLGQITVSIQNCIVQLDIVNCSYPGQRYLEYPTPDISFYRYPQVTPGLNYRNDAEESGAVWMGRTLYVSKDC